MASWVDSDASDSSDAAVLEMDERSCHAFCGSCGNANSTAQERILK